MRNYKKSNKNNRREIDPVRKFKMLQGRIRKVKRFSNGVDIEDIFLDKLLKQNEKESEIRERKLEVPLKRVNFLILFLLGIVTIGTLTYVTFKLQTQGREENELLAQQNKFALSYLNSERGVIYDRNMHQLVWNEASFDVLAVKSEIPAGEAGEIVLKELSGIIGEDIEVLKEKIENTAPKLQNAFGDYEILVFKNLPHQKLILFETKKEKLPGFKLKKRIVRHYENEGSTAHLLGYLGKISSQEFQQLEDYELGDYIGKEGLERSYEEALRERKGMDQIGRSAQGEEVSRKIIEYPRSGDSLILHLDISLQKKLEEVLTEVLKELEVQKGSVIALDPRNGAVLASVSLPSFDNNLFARGISHEELWNLNQDPNNPQLNRIIAGLYPIGSTIKPLIAVGALEEKVISPTTNLYCPLEVCLVNKYTGEGRCYPDWKFHGWTDVKKAIAESVNPFFYMIGGGYWAPPSTSEFFNPDLPKSFEGLGIENIAKYLRVFGLGEKTGVDLPGEAEGRVPDPEWKESYFADQPRAQQIWYLGDTYNLSIGQGYLLVTPIQIASAFVAIANGGKIFKPQFVQAVLDPENNKKAELEPELVKENFVGQESLKIIREGMRQAVTSPSGSAFLLNSLPVPAAAKTGTAQIYPGKEIYHNWVTVFAPFEEPEIVLVVLIENIEGTRIAAQKVAKEALGWYFTERSPENQVSNPE